MSNLNPVGRYRYEPSTDSLRLEIMDNKAAREKQVVGLLIFNANDELVCLATGLK